MLDTDTKRRIDNARDILVGKVPDPKSQVEQITIALIYKFMDDMDAEAEELGGERSFFTGEYARYGWARLMASSLGGHEMLGLYGEGIAKMPENPGIPALFRDIFKNAYLPYRDPETLKAFLKIIDGFSYDHSERLGDAFEYLLSVLGSQGDAGQFRTPRHIIDFMVEILAPQKGETILDPACGTAGFLISAYKHIRKANTDAKGNSTLTPDDRTQMAKNFLGYDISPDMVRLSLVNLYLHGFTEPHVYEYDTLTSQDRWNEFADVILANPPFMSPKGGIKPHNRFSIQAKRSEVLFVDYMAEHLNPNGRAAIIVPEGIIFQSQTAYKELRKMLVENSLVAVVSLPAGCFNPYSGVKTSILLLDKSLARQSDTVGFFKVENDGFGLNAQRRAIEKNDLPHVRTELAAYLHALRTGASTESLLALTSTGQIVPKAKVSANGDYNLSGERYREGVISNTAYPLVPVGKFMREGVKTVDPRINPDEIFELWSIPAFDAGSPEVLRGEEIGSQKKVVAPGDVLLSRIVPHIRRGWVVKENSEAWRQIASTEWIVFSSEEVLPNFLRLLLVSDFFHVSFMQTITGVGGSLSRANPTAVGEINVPLPPLDVQKEIVAVIEDYQKVINGARAVLDHYRPYIPIHPDWTEVEIGAISTIVRGSSPRPQGDPIFFGGPVPRLMVADITRDGMYATPQIDSLTELGATKSRPMKKGDVIITVSGNPGLPTILAVDACIHDGFVGLRELSKDVLTQYLYFALLALHASHGSQSVGAVFKNLTTDQIREFKIALPPLATQQAIVSEIEAEQALVAANRELITRFEQKIQATLARIWGEEESSNEATALDCGSSLPLSPPQLAAADVASRLATPKRQQAAAVQVETVRNNPAPAPEPAELPRPTRPDEMEKSDFMSLLREVLTAHGPCDRDATIKHTATALGYQRVRGGLAEILSNAIRTAVKRQVIFNERGQFSTGWSSVTDYEKDFLKTQFLAAISEQGRVWTTREEAIRAFARWLGFRRTGSVIDETARSLINGLLRESRLEKDGDRIRRV